MLFIIRKHKYVASSFIIIQNYLDLIGEGTRSETSRNRRGASVLREFQNSSLASLAAADDEHFAGVFDSDDGAGCQ